MTLRQRILRVVYPLIRKQGSTGRNGTTLNNTGGKAPSVPIYSLSAELKNQKQVGLSSFKGHKILIVNTASDCGYTGQYAELQQLHERMKEKLTILAFPSNDFKEQEKGTDSEIAEFCQVNYGVTFPIITKGAVLRRNDQQPIYKWLTDSKLNGWNDHQPDWNFAKYVIDEQGNLSHYFGPAVSPLDDEFVKAVS